MTNYLELAMLRILAMQRECISDLAGAVPYFFHWQETMPYFTNRITSENSIYYTEDFRQRTYALTMRYIVAHITEGQPGSGDARLYTDIPIISDYFEARIGLTSGAYPTFLDHLDAQNVLYSGAERVGIFDNRGLGMPVLQVGCEFTITLPFTLPIVYAAWS